MIYYRTDVLQKRRPEAAEDLGRISRRSPRPLNGKDMNGDGTPDFGSCIAKKRNAQSYWFVTDVVGSMTQSKGTSQGAFFDTKDMTPLVNNEAFRKALDFLIGIDQVRPAGRAQPRRQRHPAAVRLRPLRAQPRLGRRRHARRSTRPDSKVIGQVGRGDHAGLEGGARTGTPASSRPAPPTPARTPSTASTTRRSRPSAAGAAASTPRPMPR